MTRKFDIVAHVIVLVSFLVVGETAIGGPRLICEESSYNFGEKEIGESVEHTFIIKNVGDAPADMKQLKPQCGCAALNTKQEKLGPGAETAMTLKMSLGNQRGPFHKSLAIVSGDDKQNALNLIFEGVVESALYVLPERLELGRVDSDKEITRKVIVAFAQEEPVKITRTMSDVNAMVSEVKTLKEGGLYRVTVRIRPPTQNPRIEAKVLLYTDSAKHPMVGIPAPGSVLVDLAATPNELILAGDPSQAVTRYVVVLSPSSKPFEIKEVQCPTESVKAEVKPMGTTGYRIELSGLTATPDLDGKSVLVQTSICSAPTLQIPLHVRRPTAAQVEPQTQALPAPERAEEGVLPQTQAPSVPPRVEEATLPNTQDPPMPQPVEARTFLCEDRKADCGNVRMGPPAEHTFRLFNTSSELRHIVSVSPGCDCAKVVRFSKDVAPQSWGEVTVSLDTTGCPGIRRSSVVIATDAARKPNVNTWVSCKVLPAIELKPWNLQFAPQDSASGFQPQSVEVVGLYQDEKVALGDVQPSDPMILLAKETLDENKRFRLSVSVSKDMPAGVTNAHVDIRLDGSAQKNVRLPITITNEAQMKAEPSTLELSADEKTLQNAEFTVRSTDNSPLEVNKVELADTALNVVPQRAANNAVVVQLKDLKVTRDLSVKHIRVSTNRGELRVPITIRACTSKAAPAADSSTSSCPLPKT